jgi:hypothetical protein
VRGVSGLALKASADAGRFARDALRAVRLVWEGDAALAGAGHGETEPMHHMRVAERCDRTDERRHRCVGQLNDAEFGRSPAPARSPAI